MQPCNHMTKLIKFSWELLLKGCEIRLHNSNKNSEMLHDERDVGNEETDFRIKNLLSWQNILINRQITADIEEKWANQGEALRRGISLIYLSSSNKWKPCHGAINSRPCNLRTALEKYFRFQWNCRQLRIDVPTHIVLLNCIVHLNTVNRIAHNWTITSFKIQHSPDFGKPR